VDRILGWHPPTNDTFVLADGTARGASSDLAHGGSVLRNRLPQPAVDFGDGQINAYEKLAGGQFAHRGELRTGDGKSLAIDGLWALQFGHGTPANGPMNTVFFAAGPNDESGGLFGSISSP
jgi:hypothetical protein